MRIIVCAVAVLFALPAFAEPQVLTDDTWSLRPGAVQAQMFDVAAPSIVEWAVEAVHHADKGVTVYLCPRGIAEGVINRTMKARALRQCDNEMALTIHRSKLVQPGGWAVVVANTENVFRRADVHVRVVLK